MMNTVFTAIRFSILIMLLTGIVYPLAMTGVGQAMFPVQANGGIMKNNKGDAMGSPLIGQAFTQPHHFHGRPATNGYDASNSGGSNWSVSNPKLIDRIKADIKTYKKENGVQRNIAIDAVTASASNLDPHISLQNALDQVARVAKARGIPAAPLSVTVRGFAEQPFFAEAPYVNVLLLNQALDKHSKG